MTPENWVGDATPQPGDELQFSATPPSGGTVNDFPAGTTFKSIDFTTDGFSLSGNDLTLSDGISVASAASTAVISLNIAMAKALTIDVANGATLTISGALSGPNYLTKTSAGTLVLAAANSYTGGTVIEAGTLQLGNDNALASCGSAVLLSGEYGAELDLNGHNITVGQVGLFSGWITNSSTTSAGITAASYLVLSGAIDVDLHGTDAPLQKAGDFLATLSGANDYTGPTTVYAGQLNLTGPGAWNPVLNLGHTDIQDGKIVFNYSADLNSDPASTVLSDLTASYAATPPAIPFSSSQNQLYSSAATAATGLAWSDNATRHRVTVTRALYGDANLDGDVDMNDLGTVLANYNGTGTWQSGDFNYDGQVNLNDFSQVLTHYNQEATSLPAQVATIARLGAEQTTADSLQFVVAFSKNVTGVDAADFSLVCSNTTGNITAVTGYAGGYGSYAVYVVTVDNVYGNGTVQLNLIDNGTIIDEDDNYLDETGFNTEGEVPTYYGPTYSVSSPFVWTGGGSDGDWLTAANWAGNVLPLAGSDLYFAGTPSENGCSDDRTRVSFRSIEFGAAGFTITGAGDLTLTGGITVDAGVSDATISMNVAADSPITIDVADADATLTLSSLSGSGDLMKNGKGTVSMGGDTHTGDTTVSGGTLLVGSLPSVFADALQSGVTFNTLLSSAAVVGDPGDSGGNFALNVPGLSGGSAALGSDGILQWVPGTGCAAATYSANATYNYSGGWQIRAFSLNVSTADMPPVFCSPNGGELWNYPTAYIEGTVNNELGWTVIVTSLAAKAQGAITYQLVGDDLPEEAAIDSNGVFTCKLTLDDAWKVYDFYVRATSGGQYDLLHVLVDADIYYVGAPVVARDYPVTEPYLPTPWLVATDSADNLISLGAASSSYGGAVWLNGVLEIVTPPQHGTVAADPYNSSSVLYTPDAGYRGLDSFTYDWEYDEIDYYTHQSIGRIFTNVATQAVQVGNWLDVVPATTYQNDPHQSILGVGEKETTTLLLQNPRGDGVPATGYWSLNFDPNLIHVYTSDGQEVVPDSGGGFSTTGKDPGSRVIVTVPGYSSTAVTLTVVGIGGGVADLDATWHVWGWTGGPQAGWTWSTYQEVKYTVVEVDIYDVGRGNKKITGLMSTIMVGDGNNLKGVVTPGNLDAGGSLWVIPLDGRGNNPIAGYTQDPNNGTVDPLAPLAYLSDTIHYYWIGDGNNLVVRYYVTIDGHTYRAQATFGVLRPQWTLTLTTTSASPAVNIAPAPPGEGDNPMLEFGGPDPDHGIVWHAEVTPPASGPGIIAFTQLVSTDVEFTVDDLLGTREKRSSDGDFVLDSVPQYRDRFAHADGGVSTPFSDADRPAENLLDGDRHVDRTDDFHLYLMYKSDAADSIWVTLAELDWYWRGAATKDLIGVWSVDVGSSWYSVDPAGVDSTSLPQWNRNLSALVRVPVLG